MLTTNQYEQKNVFDKGTWLTIFLECSVGGNSLLSCCFCWFLWTWTSDPRRRLVRSSNRWSSRASVSPSVRCWSISIRALPRLRWWLYLRLKTRLWLWLLPVRLPIGVHWLPPCLLLQGPAVNLKVPPYFSICFSLSCLGYAYIVCRPDCLNSLHRTCKVVGTLWAWKQSLRCWNLMSLFFNPDWFCDQLTI